MTDGKQILVVDDEPVIRVLIKRILAQDGYRIREAGSGEQALAELKANGSDIALLLTDLAMPGMHGTELAARARTLVPNLPVLYMSGYSDELSKLQSTEFIQKPFNHSALLNKVRNAMSRGDETAARTAKPAGRLPFTRGLISDQAADETVRTLIRAEWELARKKV